ncbi:MAG: hypothetical protein WC869_00400 [Phycisphaerae bacterium]|jgi:hypothetical protein
MPHDVTHRMIEPSEFYRAQLAANKVAACPEDIAKFAAARGIPIHTAKLAKLYFEQLALDGVRYASEDERAEDAIKMATAYFDQAEEVAKTAAAVADLALTKLAAIAEELIKTEGITGVTVSELLKIASLQNDSKHEFEMIEATKAAGLKLSAAKIKITDAKLANVVVSNIPRENLYVGGVVTPESLRPDAAQMLAKHLGYEGENPAQLVGQQFGVPHDDPMFREHLHGVLQHGYNTPGSTVEGAAKSYLSNAPSQGSWAARNSKWLLPTGILGAGAAYLLYRHLKNKDNEKQQQLMAAMARRPQPAMG